MVYEREVFRFCFKILIKYYFKTNLNLIVNDTCVKLVSLDLFDSLKS